MRDGIYKTCPVSPAWRRVLKLATRPADRRDRLQSAMEDALYSDIKRDHLRNQVVDVYAILASGQGSLFSIIKDRPDISNFPLPTSQMAQDFQDQLESSLSLHPSSMKETVTDASYGCLRKHCYSMVLELVGHINKNSSGNSSEAIEVVQALKESQGKLNYRAISTSLLDDTAFGKQKPQKPKFDLDENLL